MSTTIQAKPSSFEDVVKEKVWKDDMDEQYESIVINDVWDVVPRPNGKSIVTSKWIFNIKHEIDGNIEKYKERFIARGFSQKEGEDYYDIFSPMAQYTTIHSIVSLAANQGWNLHQMDVNITF